MMRHSIGQGILASGLVGFLCSVAMGAPPAAQNPWAKVPAFPTGCYSGRDDFAARTAAAQETLSREIARQEQINKQLQDSVKMDEGTDPYEYAARMQNAMMNNPQEAMKMAQATQAAGATAEELRPKDVANQQKLDGEMTDLLTRYRAALGKAVAPVDAKFKDLDRRAQKDLVVTEAGDFYAKWAVQEYNALVRQWNAEYEKTCSAWWQASGPFHAWLKRYRDHLVQDHIPWLEQSDNAAYGFMAALGAGTTAGAYKSTATMNTVADYMKRAGEVFNNRPTEPVKRDY